jgi:hypothetical protein
MGLIVLKWICRHLEARPLSSSITTPTTSDRKQASSDRRGRSSFREGQQHNGPEKNAPSDSNSQATVGCAVSHVRLVMAADHEPSLLWRGESSAECVSGRRVVVAADDGRFVPSDTGIDQITSITRNCVTKLRQSIVEEGSVIEGFGSKADELCDRAVAAFCDRAPAPPSSSDGGSAAAAIYDAVLADVEKSVDAPLQVLYLKQLGYLREMALQQFRGRATDNKASGSSYYESMLRADADFVEAAVSSTRSGGGGGSGDNVWDYTQERGYLQAVLNLAAEQAAQRNELVVETAEKQQAAMSVLQYQNQMIQQLQNQLYGQSSPWNIGMAYRIPDTNFNVQGSYQQGRANVQISCVPDEYAPLLGPNGFTNGVGPGNLGLSLNLSL